MRVVRSWLEEYVDTRHVSASELAERLTLAGLEVVGIEHYGDWWDPQRLFVGAVVRVLPHPNADRLVLADVDYGAGSLHRVVTGAPALVRLREAGELPQPLKVAFALEGAELFDGHAEGWVKIVLRGRPVRGVMSDAMVCSAKELGLADEHEDILLLDADAPVGKPLTEVLADTVFDLDLTPNLARAMSVVGVARETAAILDLAFEEPEPDVVTVPGDLEAHVAVEIADPDLCPRYAARLIDGLQIAPSPYWMARRLTLAGMRPINNVVDITNYVMLEWGEPLHAFDYEVLRQRAGGQRPRIIVRRARPGERITTLDDVERELDAEGLLITDEAGPLAIAGIMGGAQSEISDDTKRVLLEAAAFDFISIRRTSRRQRIPSESAARFGRGVHPAMAAPASTRAAELLRQIAGGSVIDGIVDAYPRPVVAPTITLPAGEAERVLGVDLAPSAMADLLRRLQFAVLVRDDGQLEATVPPHRLDVSCPADVLEEVARLIGYDRLPARLVADPLPPPAESQRSQVQRAIQDSLAASGLLEVVSYRLTSIEHEATAFVTAPPCPASYVSLLNPISPERSVLRRSILTGLLDAAQQNLRHTDRLALFEIGPVFESLGVELPVENWRLGVLLVGPGTAATWRSAESRMMDFFDVKGVIEGLLNNLNVAAEWQPDEHPAMHPARTARLTVGDQTLGAVGELHPVVRRRWDLGDAPVALADLDLDLLCQLGGTPATFRPFSPFPPVREDLAVVVDEALPAAEVAATIRSAATSLLVDLALFDVYRGPQIGEGKKSLAWSLVFQAPDRTLTNDEVAAARERIVRALAHRLGATIRQA